jgi:hypothetical protein
MNKLKRFEKQIQKKPYEVGCVYDPDSDNMLCINKGDASNVVLRRKELAKSKIISHNHPTGKFFSLDDIRSLVVSNAKEIRAVTPNGKVWIARLIRKPTPAEFANFANKWRNAFSSKDKQKIKDLLTNTNWIEFKKGTV